MHARLRKFGLTDGTTARSHGYTAEHEKPARATARCARLTVTLKLLGDRQAAYDYVGLRFSFRSVPGPSGMDSCRLMTLAYPTSHRAARQSCVNNMLAHLLRSTRGDTAISVYAHDFGTQKADANAMETPYIANPAMKPYSPYSRVCLLLTSSEPFIAMMRICAQSNTLRKAVETGHPSMSGTVRSSKITSGLKC